jgi:hypothetical protein
LVQELVGLLLSHAQICLANFEQLVPDAQTTERQWGVGAADDHKVHAWGQVIEEVDDGSVIFSLLNEVVIVKD